MERLGCLAVQIPQALGPVWLRGRKPRHPTKALRRFLHQRPALTPGPSTVLVGLVLGHPACGDFAGHELRRFWPSTRRESRSGGRPIAGSPSRKETYAGVKGFCLASFA